MATEPAPALAAAPASSSGAELFAARGRAMMAVSALFFGAMAVAAREVSSELGAAQIALLRFAIGLAGVAGVALVRRDTLRATRPGLLLLRGLFGGVAVLLYFMAIERLGAGLATLLNYTFPLWAALFAALTLGEKLTGRVAAGMALATLGLVVVVGPAELARFAGGLETPQIQLGLACGLASSVAGGAATTVVRALRRTDSALAVFGGFCLVGLFVCLPFAWRDWRPVSGHAALVLLLVGTLSFGAQVLFSWSLGYVTAGSGSLATQLTVVASYGFAALLLGEVPSPHAVVGGLVVTAGVLVASLAGELRPGWRWRR